MGALTGTCVHGGGHRSALMAGPGPSHASAHCSYKEGGGSSGGWRGGAARTRTEKGVRRGKSRALLRRAPGAAPPAALLPHAGSARSLWIEAKAREPHGKLQENSGAEEPRAGRGQAKARTGQAVAVGVGVRRCEVGTLAGGRRPGESSSPLRHVWRCAAP